MARVTGVFIAPFPLTPIAFFAQKSNRRTGTFIAENFGLSVVSISVSAPTQLTSQLDITFSNPFSLSGVSATASNWIINGSPTVTVTAIVASNGNKTLTLTTTEQLTGGSYSLLVPAGFINSLNNSGFISANPYPFTGSGLPATLANVTGVDERTISIIFSKAVTDATTASKYSLTGGITVSAVKQVSQTNYLLTTSVQLPDTGYTLTATGVHDTAGN